MAETLTAPEKAKSLGGRSLDVHVLGRYAQQLGEPSAHLLANGPHLGHLGDHRGGAARSR